MPNLLSPNPSKPLMLPLLPVWMPGMIDVPTTSALIVVPKSLALPLVACPQSSAKLISEAVLPPFHATYVDIATPFETAE